MNVQCTALDKTIACRATLVLVFHHLVHQHSHQLGGDLKSSHQELAITRFKPDNDAPTEQWVIWFCSTFLPHWIERAQDSGGFGFIDHLDQNAQQALQNRRTLLAQARLLFTFSHLTQVSTNSVFEHAADVAHEALLAFRNNRSGYQRALSGNRQPTGDLWDERAYSYDQSFVILGIATWGHQKSDRKHAITAELEACWAFIESELIDPVTGLLLEHDGLTEPASASAPNRAQNPHMHLYEAALQAFEMTQQSNWLERAARIRCKGIEYFYDQSSGTITEFLTPELKPLSGREGLRREIGHQCEWAWLLNREIELGGDKQVRNIADSLLTFADTFGFATQGIMRGAAFDAVSADTQWREESFLLWPQTEAIKTHAIRSEHSIHANNALSLMRLVFQRYFAENAAFVNQLDNTGTPIWSEALSRLLYHLVLAITEGARAGLWKLE